MGVLGGVEKTESDHLTAQRLRVKVGVAVGLLIVVVIVTPTIVVLLRKKSSTITGLMNITESLMTTEAAITTSSFIEKETNVVTSLESATIKNIVTSNGMTTNAAKSITSTSIAKNVTALQIFNRTNEIVYAIWNTTAGSNSLPSSAGGGEGEYWPSEPPEAALDGNLSTEYTNHGCADECFNITSGMYTGFYFTIKSAPFRLMKFCMGTNVRHVKRDPMTITIEGSNNDQSELPLGKSWTLIYSGSSGLTESLNRSSHGTTQTVATNVASFRSYRLIVTSTRGKHNSASYSEFVMMGQYLNNTN
ncbi:unnamed protein product [Adineta ricciae]|uniref:Uncharacterized protein n=1 Tax=Adineta ricciae TaxID=249248 RepID=A0A813PGS5_ADIRI|nr:unnamed protein product [Adineta ricciae]